MSRSKSLIITITGTIFLLTFIVYPSCNRALQKQEHTHIASSKRSVYIGGEHEPACIINTELERTINEMAQDFGECLKVHKKYRAKAGY